MSLGLTFETAGLQCTLSGCNLCYQCQEQQKTIEMINKQHAEQQKQFAEFKTEATKRIAELGALLQKH